MTGYSHRCVGGILRHESDCGAWSVGRGYCTALRSAVGTASSRSCDKSTGWALGSALRPTNATLQLNIIWWIKSPPNFAAQRPHVVLANDFHTWPFCHKGLFQKWRLIFLTAHKLELSTNKPIVWTRKISKKSASLPSWVRIIWRFLSFFLNTKTGSFDFV